jgi:CRISPR-associated endoribonuclease Cas6
LTFDLYPLRFQCTARRPIMAGPNFLRGGFGKALREIDRQVYDQWFEPQLANGPSGLRDAPRPFVFRSREANVPAGGRFEFGFHLFDTRNPRLELLSRVFGSLAQVDSVEGRELLRLPLESTAPADRVRVCFLTPTELKGADRPDFAALFARIRDRVATLRALYGSGPLDIDFKAMGERAALVKMIRCELAHVDAERTSRRTGQTHSLGGFTGAAEYAGALGEFLPYLEIARWTGVGRQTVWGKGEISCETF